MVKQLSKIKIFTIIVLLNQLSFYGFATSNPTSTIGNSFPPQSIGISVTCNELLGGPVNKKEPPKIINLDTPGNYRLIGVSAYMDLDTSDLQDHDESEIIKIVSPEDLIAVNLKYLVAVHPGTYNITLDNVRINYSDDKTNFNKTPFRIANYTNVNLTLKGENIIKADMVKSTVNYGLFLDSGAKLTITKSESDPNASLYLSGKLGGIVGYNNSEITMKNVKVTAVGQTNGILMLHYKNIGGSLNIENSDIETSTKTGGSICARTIKMDGDSKIIAHKLCGVKIFINNSELITHYINNELWNHKNIRKLEKIFGHRNNKGLTTSCSKVNTRENDMVIGYFMKFKDPQVTLIENRYLYIIDGLINGIEFTYNDNDYNLKDGNNFVSESSRNNYNDINVHLLDED